MLPMGRPRACALTSCLNAPTRGMRLSVYCCDCPAIALFAAETLPPLGNASISGPQSGEPGVTRSMSCPWNRGQSTIANAAGGSDAHSHTVRRRRHSDRQRRPSSTHYPLPDCCPEIAPGRLRGEETRLRAPRPSKMSSSMISCSVACSFFVATLEPPYSAKP